MPAKATRKKTKPSATRAKKATSAAVSKAKKSVSKTAASIKRAAKNPKRTVKQAASNVHGKAVDARKVGQAVVTAGEIIKQTADFVDSMTQRATTRATRTKK